MRLWVSRDNVGIHMDRIGIDIWEVKPTWSNGIYDTDSADDLLVCCCAVGFERITGIHIEPGELRLVDLSIACLTIKPEETHA